MKSRLALFVGLGMSGVLTSSLVSIGQQPPATSSPAQAQKPALSADQRAVLAVSDQFDKAFNKGDIVGLMAIFADDVRIVDEAGEVYDGKDAVKEIFINGFEKQPGASIETVVDSIRLITPDVAVEDGTSLFTTSDNDPVSTTYQAVYVKKGGSWRLSQLRDYKSPVAHDSAAHSEYLTAIGWLEGEWLMEGPGGVVHVHAGWIDDGNAIEVKFSRKEGTFVRSLATIRVGYDPQSRRIKSWTFDAAGGHGTSTWAKVADQNTWLLKNEAVLPDGKAVSASQLLTIDEAGNKIVWTTFDRAIDGVITPSREEVTLTRQAPTPKPAPAAKPLPTKPATVQPVAKPTP